MSAQHRTLGLLMIAFAGCASADPPLDELSLSDALGAKPDVIAAMPFEARRSLAIRFHADDLAQPAPVVAGVTARQPLPALEGRDPASPTDAIETRALSGTAGMVLADKLAQTHATHLVRVTQKPGAITSDGDTLYVNASYLVAMAAYDQPTNGVAADDPQPGTTLQPTPYTFCSVAGEDNSRERRLFWILGPLAFVLLRGRAWKRRSKRG